MGNCADVGRLLTDDQYLARPRRAYPSQLAYQAANPPVPLVSATVGPTKTRSSDWLVVMQFIVVHSRFEAAAATGLFGLLGDGPVQIVNVAEEARVDAFFDLAET